MITHRQIEAFKAIMETGTVMSAADQLNISQSAVSHQLSELEARLDYPLFERRKGRLTPRREAHELYAEVERSFSGLRRIEDEAVRIGRKKGGRLRIVTQPAFVNGPLPRAMGSLLAKKAGILVNAQVRSPHNVIEGVAGQHYDLGLATLPAEHPDVETALVERLPFHCVLHPDHPLADRQSLTFEDIADIKFISVTGEGTSHPCGQMKRMYRKAGVEMKPAVECSTVDLACRLVADGVGAVFAPAICIDDRMRPHLRAIPFTPDIWVDLAVLHAKNQPPGILARRFIKALGEILREGGVSGSKSTARPQTELV